MKIIATLVLAIIGLQTNAQTEKISISAFKSIDIDYEDFKTHNVKITNTSKTDVTVAVVNIIDNKQLKGFGLNGKSNAIVSVDKGSKLVLSNKNPMTVEVELSFTEKVVKPKNDNVYVQFTLRNSSAKAIPLIIPNVMNPNLSPFSNSGVRLKIGQEILFKNKGRRETLLVVSSDIKNGDKLDVAALIKERRKELPSKK